MEQLIQSYFHCCVTEKRKIGSGAAGTVYRITIDQPPFTLAVKTSVYENLLVEEYKTIQFLNDRVDCKLPKLYFLHTGDDLNYYVMEFLDGKSAERYLPFFRRKKKQLADEIVDNLLRLQSVHNDKFGPVENAHYDSWLDYYTDFADEIYAFCCEQKSFDPLVMKAVTLARGKLSSIMEQDAIPTLIHGDYWAPNFIVDWKTMHLVGVIDPFHIIWAEPEYELFALTVGAGKRLHLYERYKKKVQTSRYCDLKVELYALFNELYWCKKMDVGVTSYVKFRSRRLLRQLKRNHLL